MKQMEENKMNENTIAERAESLAYQLNKLKVAENEARLERVRKEQELASLLGVPEEGSKTYTAGDFKVTVKQPVNMTIDQGEAARVAATQKEHPFKSQFKLDLTAFRNMAKNNQAAYAEACLAITSKPGKVSVTLTPTNKETA